MSDSNFPHLFIPQEPSQIGYTAQQSFSSVATRNRDRGEHAERLTREFTSAIELSVKQLAAIHSNRKGHYIEFSSSPGFDLALKSLDPQSTKIRLLNVRETTHKDGIETRATVFIPKGQESYFLEKFKKYATENHRLGQPQNRALVEGIEHVRAALLQELWTDDPARIPGGAATWVEVWLSSTEDDALARTRKIILELQIKEHSGRRVLRFPDRSVMIVWANSRQLQSLIEFSGDLAEIRCVAEVAGYFINLPNAEQAEWVEDLNSRVHNESDGKVAVCVLDGGVNHGHPLLRRVLKWSDVYQAQPHWGTFDKAGHGTAMIGMAAYGDIKDLLLTKERIGVGYVLESVKVFPSGVSQDLWGQVTSQAISEVEIAEPTRSRVFCMAVGSDATRRQGAPSSWSGQLDQLSAGVDGGRPRLIVVSAGNTDENGWVHSPVSNFTDGVYDPAQAWNVLTVGASTHLVQMEGNPDLAPVAAQGAISPFSTTSYTWDKKWPIKPEVLFEGGNVAVDGKGQRGFTDDLSLLGIWHRFHEGHFREFSMTSAATAQAARLAARIQLAYPEAWPETVRGLIVHSSDWTEHMLGAYRTSLGRQGYVRLLRTCGYGIPSERKALRSLKNSLTLVAQSSLQPFEKGAAGLGSKEMHLFRLPWPKEALLELAETMVELRVTLSYFIEPGPGEKGWKDRYRYASHGLRFFVNLPGEDRDRFVKRVNAQARDADAPNDFDSDQRWTLGQIRNVGSIHSDKLCATAAELATCDFMAVTPVVGWWRERQNLNRWNSVARYSLIVSLESPIEDVDIYTPVSNVINVSPKIPVSILA